MQRNKMCIRIIIITIPTNNLGSKIDCTGGSAMRLRQLVFLFSLANVLIVNTRSLVCLLSAAYRAWDRDRIMCSDIEAAVTMLKEEQASQRSVQL